LALEAAKAKQLALAGNTAAAGALAREQAAFSAGITGSFGAYLGISWAFALLEAGAIDEAADCAAKALECAGRLPSDRWTFEALIIQAGIELERGAETVALDKLQRALHIGAERDFKNAYSLWQSRRAAELLALALRRNVMSDYARKLITRRKLPAPADARVGSLWPVTLRVQTLGGFAIWINGEPLAKADLPRKPLEVLKALIGLGPGEVSLASLAERLWPELEGDAAHSACEVAIHRLRKLLGDESLLVVSHGAAVLKGADVWVDVEAFRQLAPRVRTQLAVGIRSAPEAERFARELMAAYPGHFLPAEEGTWAVTVREQLRSRFVQLASDLSAALEFASSFQAVVELNRHAIALDPLVEPFHRGLMSGLISQGQKSAALEAFRCCRKLLALNLQVEPSAETYELYRRARQI